LPAVLSQLPQFLPPGSFGWLFQAYYIIALTPQALVHETYLCGFPRPIDTLKHNEQSAAEAVAWEGHTAEDREHRIRGTAYITLALAHGGMGYCCVSLWERIGVRKA
jgi:hypothetical protein